MAITKRSKINNVIWADTDKTLFKVFFNNEDNPIIESKNSKEWLAEKVKKQFTDADIDTNTNDYNKYVGERTVMFEQFLETYLEWKDWKDNRRRIEDLEEQLRVKPKEVIVEKVVEKEVLNEVEKIVEKEVEKVVEVEKVLPTTLKILLDLAEDKATFFKLKLEIFELDQIKNSKDRDMKASLRKSKTVPELLAHLHAAIPDLGNESLGDPDKIPLQDVTNQPDNEGSN